MSKQRKTTKHFLGKRRKQKVLKYDKLYRAFGRLEIQLNCAVFENCNLLHIDLQLYFALRSAADIYDDGCCIPLALAKCLMGRK